MSVGVRFVQVLDFAKRPPHFLDDFHLFERSVHSLHSGAYRVHEPESRSLRSHPCVLAGGARRLGRDAFRLSGIAQALSLLSSCLQRLALSVAGLTRFLRQSSELFRRRQSSELFRRVSDILG